MRRKRTVPYYILLVLFFTCISCKYKNKPPNVDIVLHNNPDIPNKEAKVLFERGLSCIEQGDYGGARRCFSEANHECPNVPVILNGIGSTFSQTGNPALGNTYFERALKIDSDFMHSYTNMGASLNLLSQFENAKEIFRLGLARPSATKFYRSELFLNLANSYYLEGEYDSALVFIDSAKMNSRHGKIYDLAVQAQIAINRKMPLPATKR